VLDKMVYTDKENPSIVAVQTSMPDKGTVKDENKHPHPLPSPLSGGG